MRTSESVNCRDKTLVLVEKTGNGKSATGNSIIGRKVFDSEFSLAGVTSMCQLETTKLDDGQILNVIDTPGLLDSSVKPHVIAKEIARCITLAKDGIHSFILVLSIGNRFAEDEVSVFHGLHQIFGPKIANYMIVVFCHGDVVPENQCLDDVLSRACPELLQRTLEMCGNRCVLFDNKTKDEAKISRQREELISIVNDVVDNNGGMPYTNDLFDELKNGDWNLIDPEISDEGQQRFERLIVMVESRLREGMERLEKQLEEERAARQEAEARAQSAEASSKEEIQKLAATLERAQLEAEARERAARQEAEAKAQEAEARSKEEMHKLTALLEMSRLEAEARERAAREEAEAKAQEAEARSKEERDKLAALLENARSEAEAREKGAREEAEAQEAEKMSRLEAEAKMQHLNLEKLVGLMLERSRSEAEANMKHLSWEIQNIRNRKGSVMKVMMQRTFSANTEMN